MILLMTLISCNKRVNSQNNAALIDTKYKVNNIIEKYLEEKNLVKIKKYKCENKSYILYSENENIYNIALFRYDIDIKEYKLIKDKKIDKDLNNTIDLMNLKDKSKNCIVICVLDPKMKKETNRIRVEFDNKTNSGISSVEVFPITNGLAVVEQDSKDGNFLVNKIFLKKDKKIIYSMISAEIID